MMAISNFFTFFIWDEIMIAEHPIIYLFYIIFSLGRRSFRCSCERMDVSRHFANANGYSLLNSDPSEEAVCNHDAPSVHDCIIRS